MTKQQADAICVELTEITYRLNENVSKAKHASYVRSEYTEIIAKLRDLQQSIVKMQQPSR